MNTNYQPPSYQQSVYRIIGFDRLNFVSDVANAIPQDEHCRITGLSFEGDGIRVNGYLTVQADDMAQWSLIDYQLRAIKGLVSVQQTN
ncbi:hypothetical protein [Fibrella arboris]|uniref:hypothetical protein n=1 Tax=Fibrella arboris TaxID=3242486 RepID=UPI00351FF8C9